MSGNVRRNQYIRVDDPRISIRLYDYEISHDCKPVTLYRSLNVLEMPEYC